MTIPEGYKAAKIAEEAIRKTIPMEVTDIHVDEFYCPSCGEEIPCDNSSPGEQWQVYDFCSECGQRLYIANEEEY